MAAMGIDPEHALPLASKHETEAGAAVCGGSEGRGDDARNKSGLR
jgi:hypothetical protein